MFEYFEGIVAVLEATLETRNRRHIVGGMFLSVSSLFAGLALTAMTIGREKEKEDEQRNQRQCDI